MKEEQAKNLKFAIYARKSTESDERQTRSIGDQIEFADEIVAKEGYKVVEVITDSKSAKKPDQRKGFSRLLELVESGEVDAILTWKINRLSRNAKEAGMIQQLLHDEKIKIIHTVERSYKPDDNTLLFSVDSGQSIEFSRKLSKDTTRGVHAKAAEGGWPGLAPTGYLNDKLNKSIIIDEPRAAVLRKLFDLLLTGAYSVAEIHRIAVEKYSLTSRRTGVRNGGAISKSSLYRIFTNPFYAGIIRYADKEVPGKHKPIITLDEFDKAQVILGKKGKPRKKKHSFAYTGLMQCPERGASITGERKEKFVKETGKVETYTYYRCTRRKNTKTFKCKQPSVTLAEMESQMEALLTSIEMPELVVSWAIDTINMIEEKDLSARQRIVIGNKKRVEEKKKQLANLINMRASDLINDREFRDKKEEFEREINELEGVSRDERSTSERLELTKETFRFTAGVRERFRSGDTKAKQIIAKKLGKSYLLKDKKVVVEVADCFKPFQKYQKAILQALEPTKSSSIKGKSEAPASLIPVLGG